MKIHLVGLLLTACSLLAITTSAQQAPVSYSVDLTRANTHYITVEMTFEPVDEKTQIMMPVWTPGSYLIREYPKQVDRIVAKGAKGKKLNIEKVTKNRWQVDCGDNKSVTVKYRLYCHERSVRTNWVSHDYAILNGAPTFITVPEYLDREHVVQLNLPDVWKRSATSLKGGDSPHQFVASDYHELVDSPIVAGSMVVYPFEVGGVPHQFVNVNERGFWDGARAAKDLAKIVKAHHDVWGTVPYDRYLFINVVGGGGGGLEHDNSCLMLASRWTCGNESTYQSWLSLASHEFFHTWNIRRLRPEGLVKYDYETENYTPSLWIAEGITSYYEDLLLVRAGLISRTRFVSELSTKISRVQNAEGRKVQSLRDASHDAWIKFYRPGENSSETTISYYTKGCVAGMLLDAEIRTLSEGEKSLDDVMRRLYKKHSGSVGYKPSDFRAICSDVAGSDMSDWFKSAIDSTDELEFQNICNWYGLEIGDVKPQRRSRKKKKDDDESEKSKDEDKADENGEENAWPGSFRQFFGGAPGRSAGSRDRQRNQRPWLGATASSDNGKLIVTRVTPDSPATAAGLVINDEIIAINEFRVTSIETRLRHYDVGQTINLMVAREDRMMEIPITIGTREPRKRWSARLTSRPNKQQSSHRDSWLNTGKKESKKEKTDAEEKKKSPKKKSDGVDY